MLAASIQNHHSRDPATLLASLTDLPHGATVIRDDTDERDTWRTHRRCLDSMAKSATHLLVIQDDAIPQPDWLPRTKSIIEAHPDPDDLPVTPGFGHLRRTFLKAQLAKADCCDLQLGAFVPLVATVYPRSIVERVLGWADGDQRAIRRISRRGADDGIVAEFCRREKIVPLATVPCVFDHDDTVPSVHGTRRPGPHRRAALL